MLMGMALADSVTTISQTPNTILYNVTLNKSYGTGIYSFALNGIYNNRLINYTASYTSCSITNAIYCNVGFIIEAGAYGNMLALKNGIAVASLTLPAELNTTTFQGGSGSNVSTSIINNSNSILYIVIAITAIGGISVVGNIIYYLKNKGNIYGNIR